RANVAADLTAKAKTTPPEVKEEKRLIITDLPNIVPKDDPGKTKDKSPQKKSAAPMLGDPFAGTPGGRDSAVRQPHTPAVFADFLARGRERAWVRPQPFTG